MHDRPGTVILEGLVEVKIEEEEVALEDCNESVWAESWEQLGDGGAAKGEEAQRGSGVKESEGDVKIKVENADEGEQSS